MPLARPFAISQEKGALTSIYLSTSPDVDAITGQYFVKGEAVKPSAAALDDDAAVRLWEISENLTAA
jgi:retinol dehydrogenase-12